MHDEAVRTELEKILASEIFGRSDRLSRFLRFSVEQSLEGRGGSLKEYLIALQVFDKDQSFDPRLDPIVRVQARRLRAALTEYYATQGTDDPVVIEVPTGGYAPSFWERQSVPAGTLTMRVRAVWLAAAAGLLVAGIFGYWLVKRNADPITSVAVLPFADLSPQKDQEYFCDGLSDEIIDALTKIDGVRVPARTSSFQFKGKNVDVAEIGARLRVAAVLEGSVRRSGDRLRVTAQLIKVADGNHIWSQTFDREVTDIFAIQEEISRAVAKNLNVQGPVMPRRTENPEAYALCLQGRFHFNQWTRESMQKSTRYFQQAIARDPNYALAYSGLADSQAVLAHWGAVEAREGWSQSREALEKALRLDPHLAEAHVVLAMRKSHYEWDWSGAELEFRRALELNPHSTDALGSFAVVLNNLGRFEEAEAQLRKALDLDPLSARRRTSLGIGHYWSRQYDRAIDCFREVLVLEPNFPQAQIYLGAAYAQKQMFAAALATLGTARSLAPRNAEIISLLGYTYGRALRRDKALEILAEMKQLSQRQSIPALDFANVHIALGDTERALKWIELAREAREGRVVQLKVDPRYDPLRSEPRFQAVLKTIGLAF